jgi:hypothetical protein
MLDYLHLRVSCARRVLWIAKGRRQSSSDSERAVSLGRWEGGLEVVLNARACPLVGFKEYEQDYDSYGAQATAMGISVFSAWRPAFRLSGVTSDHPLSEPLACHLPMPFQHRHNMRRP